MSLWKKRTSNQYNTYLIRRGNYFKRHKISMLNPGVNKAIEFQTVLFHQGLEYIEH